jgi:phospholipase D/transphosphatidylase
MQQAVILRPSVDDKGRRVRNHAKFLVVDHQILVVTSANLSLSAEERNVELGLRIDDPLLARAVEDQMRALEDVGIYERVGRKG